MKTFWNKLKYWQKGLMVDLIIFTLIFLAVVYGAYNYRADVMLIDRCGYDYNLPDEFPPCTPDHYIYPSEQLPQYATISGKIILLLKRFWEYYLFIFIFPVALGRLLDKSKKS